MMTASGRIVSISNTYPGQRHDFHIRKVSDPFPLNTKKYMEAYGYQTENSKPNLLLILFYMFILPVKTLLSLALNMRRMKNIREAVFRRFLDRKDAFWQYNKN